MWMLALSDYIKYGKRNLFVAFQISLLLIVLIVMTAVIHEEYRRYAPVAGMDGYEGIVYRNPGCYAPSPEALVDGISGIENVFTYGSTGFFSENQEQYFAAAVYTDEIIEAFSPELSQGRWFDSSRKEPEVVISQNANGWNVGDNITLWYMDPEQKRQSLTAHVCGMLKEGAVILGSEFGKSGDFHHDYRDLYSTYQYRQKQEPLLMFRAAALNRYHVPSSYGKTCLAVYSKGQTNQAVRKIESGLLNNAEKYTVAQGDVQTEALSDFMRASKRELAQTLLMYLPLLFCILLVTLISLINVCTLNTRENYRQNAVFFLLGLHWKQCRYFALYQSLCTIIVSCLLTAVCIGVIRLMRWQAYFCVDWNILTTISISAALIVLCLISVAIPGHMMRKKQPVEILREEGL